MFHVGEEVRVIPASYLDMSKEFFNYPGNWHPSDKAKDRVVMLGGRYSILGVEQIGGANWYRLLPHDENNRGKVSESALLGLAQFVKCEFSVGEKVKFMPRCSNADLRDLQSSRCYRFSDIDTVYEIKSVLNDYYLFLDYTVDQPCATPLRWEDFVRVDEKAPDAPGR